MSAASQNNRSALAASSSTNKGFTVIVRPTYGPDMEIKNCNDDTYISELIDKLRHMRKTYYDERRRVEQTSSEENSSEEKTFFEENWTKPTLAMKSPVRTLKPNSTLSENEIVDGTTVYVFYNLDASCHLPFLSGNTFPVELHRCIENDDKEMDHIRLKVPLKNGIVKQDEMDKEAWARAQKYYNDHPDEPPLNFKAIPTLSMFKPANIGTVSAGNASPLLVYHNKWKWDTETLFYLSKTPKPHFNSVDIEDPNIAAKPIRYEPYNGDNVGVGHDNFRLSYRASRTGLEHSIIVQNGSSVQGTLSLLSMRIMQTNESDHYKRVFDITMSLTGPIKIIGPDNVVKLELEDATANIHVPYHYIVMCDESERLSLLRDRLKENNNETRSSQAAQSSNQGAQGLGLRFGLPPAGGRRTRRSKRSKRTKNKRKTRGRSRK